MLVFWLGAVAGIVTFFIAVKIRDLTSVMLLSFFNDVNGIITNGRGFFGSLIYFYRHLILFCLAFFLAGSVILSHSGTDLRS